MRELRSPYDLGNERILIVRQLVAADSGLAIGGERRGGPGDPRDLSCSHERLLGPLLQNIESGNRRPDECQCADREPYETAQQSRHFLHLGHPDLSASAFAGQRHSADNGASK
jgi:hypothetical protein